MRSDRAISKRRISTFDEYDIAIQTEFLHVSENGEIVLKYAINSGQIFGHQSERNIANA